MREGACLSRIMEQGRKSLSFPLLGCMSCCCGVYFRRTTATKVPHPSIPTCMELERCETNGFDRPPPKAPIQLALGRISIPTIDHGRVPFDPTATIHAISSRSSSFLTLLHVAWLVAQTTAMPRPTSATWPSRCQPELSPFHELHFPVFCLISSWLSWMFTVGSWL